VYAWDVVNEAIMDDGKYRTESETEADQRSPWYGIAQEAYIAEAFKYAHEADPDAKLFYNEYYNYIPAKQQAIHAMLKKLLADGVPIHGVGLQAHLSIAQGTVETHHGYHQTIANMEAAIELYASLGLEVQVTELDMSVYTPGVKYTPETFYTPATFSEALQQQQAQRYGEFFALFRKHKDVITGVTFWGIADDNTWLSEFSSGRQDFPMLFDGKHQPKPAFYAVVGF
jgi:endo-1,4-beta-xylanase